ncbi:MAG: hypothetical protein KF684_03760 [Phycisphaeraceae bacterium]|nr:hypothetical protein [Phycisphaeraceae bacterium]
MNSSELTRSGLSLRAARDTHSHRPARALPDARWILGALALSCALGHAALAADALPLRSVTLYRSGVGYFERTGVVDGAATVDLRFDVNHLNDVLKSMVVLDAQGQTPPTVAFESAEPLDKALGGFQVDLRRADSIYELLGQLRGAEIDITTGEGPVRGMILSVETRGEPEKGQFVSVLTDAGVKTVPLARMVTFNLLDKQLASELRVALRTLASRRAENQAGLGVRFGEGRERDVTIGYIHESPVWKTSYRLVLPDETGAKPMLQGWAIVENQTDEDWDGVRMSLASGRPVAFTMNLREPLFVARPDLPLPIPGVVTGRAYSDAVAARAPASPAADGRVRMERDASAITGQSIAPARVAESNRMGAGSFSASLASVADAQTSGELFRYEIKETVTIPRRTSAMLPILGSSVEGRRVSIYNPNDLREHPMRGVEFTNTSGADLAAGPIAVYDADSYAGDAQVGFTSRGQQRLASYAVDQDVRALVEPWTESRITKVRIVNGVLEQESRRESTTGHRFVNRDASRGRTIIVEHPKMPGWTLLSPASPASESETVQRFEVALDRAGEATLDITHERVDRSTVALVQYDLDLLVRLSSDGRASKQVVDAVRKAGEMQRAVRDIDAMISALNTERGAIASDQGRVRENMGRVDRNSDLYARYMRTLTEQEDRLEQIEQETRDLRAKREMADRSLREYLAGLTID